MEHILAAGKIKHKFAVRLQTVLHMPDSVSGETPG
jgi:hypothetical protein